MAESGRMHRKAEEEAASGANGDDDNTARRRPGPSDAAWYLWAWPLAQGIGKRRQKCCDATRAVDHDVGARRQLCGLR